MTARKATTTPFLHSRTLSKIERSQKTHSEQEHTFAHSDIVGTFVPSSRKKTLVFYTVSFIILINL